MSHSDLHAPDVVRGKIDAPFSHRIPDGFALESQVIIRDWHVRPCEANAVDQLGAMLPLGVA